VPRSYRRADSGLTGEPDSRIGKLADLVRADVELEVPPLATWFTCRDAVFGFLATRVLRRAGNWRMVSTRQPAVSARRVRTDRQRHARSARPTRPDVVDGRIARITSFDEPSLVIAAGLARSPVDR
jgi:hypothetical protein